MDGMKTQPKLSEAFLERWLNKHYHLIPQRVRFMPRGECSWGFVLDAPDGQYFFLKLWQLGLCEGNLTEDHIQTMMTLYYEFGLQQMTPPPVRSLSSGNFINRCSRYQAVLLPWVDGYPATDKPLNDFQQRQLGALLATLHSAKLAVRERPRQENFSPHYISNIKRLLKATRQPPQPHRDTQEPMVQLLRSTEANILRLLDEFEALRGAALQIDATHYVVCHGDPSSGNIVVSRDDQVILIDWDTLCYAPPERDLFFIHDMEGALDGYQRVAEDYTLNETLIRYYQAHWILQEILEYGERTLFTEQSAAQCEHDVASLEYELKQAKLI